MDEHIMDERGGLEPGGAELLPPEMGEAAPGPRDAEEGGLGEGERPEAEPRRTRRRAMQKSLSDMGIGTITLVSDDGRGGIISLFDSKEEAYFQVEDIESQVTEQAHLRGRIVQFAKEHTKIGIRARDIIFLDQKMY